jgi:hypothetical protein
MFSASADRICILALVGMQDFAIWKSGDQRGAWPELILKESLQPCRRRRNNQASARFQHMKDAADARRSSRLAPRAGREMWSDFRKLPGCQQN